MHLRVFSNASGNLLVEISHPHLASRKIWVVPMLSTEDALQLKVGDDDSVRVRFNEAVYRVRFLSIRTLNPATTIKQIGVLDENYSRDILNNVKDLLAWD